jgi:hypothetical protein
MYVYKEEKKGRLIGGRKHRMSAVLVVKKWMN